MHPMLAYSLVVVPTPASQLPIYKKPIYTSSTSNGKELEVGTQTMSALDEVHCQSILIPCVPAHLLSIHTVNMLCPFLNTTL